MDNRSNVSRMKTDLYRSSLLLILLMAFSIFGIAYGVVMTVINGIWINIPNHYPMLLMSGFFVLLVTSILIFRKTKTLSSVFLKVGNK